MFRIKTDIRQYKCETQEKVEKLIRNWVIRPNDLIYSAEEQAWRPIGDHPAFVALFALLDEQMRAEPDTVVTADPQRSVERSGSAVASRRAGRELAYASTEITRVQERTARLAPAAEPLPIPEAPEGVEGVLRSSDEITVMTERTLDLIGVDDEADEEEEPTGERRLRRGELPEELFATNEISSPVLDTSDEPPLDELGELEAALDSAETGEGDGDAAQDRERTKVASRPSRWRIRIDDQFLTTTDEDAPAAEESAGDADLDADAGVVDDEDLRQTNELTDEEVASIARLREEQRAEQERLAEQEEAVVEADDELVVAETIGQTGPLEEVLASEAPEVEVSEVEAPEVEASSVEAPEVEAPDVEAPEVEVEAIEGAPTGDEAAGDDDLDDDEWDDDEWDDDEPIEIVPVTRVQNLDFISDGYSIPLPFEVRPSDADIARGLKQTNVSRAEKDRAFPPPRPHKPGKVVMHTYRLVPEPPRDRSRAIYIAVAVAVVVLIALAIAW